MTRISARSSRCAVFILITSLVVGLNVFGNSRDRQNYLEIYDGAVDASWADIIYITDAGFSAFAKFISMLGGGFGTFMVIAALISFSLKSIILSGKGVKKSIFVALYFSNVFWLHDYTQVRAALALGLFIFSFYRPTRLSLPIMLVAASIHASILILIAIYFLAKFVSLRLYLCLVLPLFILVPLAGPGWLDVIISINNIVVKDYDQRIGAYITLMESGNFGGVNILALMPALQAIMLAICIKKLKELTFNVKVEIFFSAFGCLAFYVFSSFPTFAIRTYELFIPFFLVFISRSQNKSLILYILIFVYIVIGARGVFFGVPPIVPFF